MTRVPTHRLSPAASATSAATNDDNPWARAACLKEDPELFFPDSRGAIGEATRTAYAKAICATCDLQPTCLQGARERREPWGVWGGELFIAGVVSRPRRRRSGGEEAA